MTKSKNPTLKSKEGGLYPDEFNLELQALEGKFDFSTKGADLAQGKKSTGEVFVQAGGGKKIVPCDGCK